MRVLIAGGGQVGALIARRLVREGNEVTIVDLGPERCRLLEAQLDAKVAGAARAQDVGYLTEHPYGLVVGTETALPAIASPRACET